jgi:hypothetical protein
MFHFRIWLLFAAFFAVVGCTGPRLLSSNAAEGVDLSSYKTFDFYKVEASGDTITGRFSGAVPKLEDAIALEMQKYGYLMTKTDPDLLINIGVVVDERVQTRQTDYRTDAPKYIGQRRYSWKSEEVEVGRYRQGTVTIDLVDRVQNKMVWNATVRDVLPAKEAKIDESIKEGVEKLFEKFPLAKKK